MKQNTSTKTRPAAATLTRPSPSRPAARAKTAPRVVELPAVKPAWIPSTSAASESTLKHLVFAMPASVSPQASATGFARTPR